MFMTKQLSNLMTHFLSTEMPTNLVQIKSHFHLDSSVAANKSTSRKSYYPWIRMEKEPPVKTSLYPHVVSVKSLENPRKRSRMRERISTDC